MATAKSIETVELLPLLEVDRLIANKCTEESRHSIVSTISDIFRELYKDGFAICATRAVKRLKINGSFEREHLEAVAAFLLRRVARARASPEISV